MWDDPKYGTNASGIFIVPSGCCPFSRIAAIVLPIANPLPFKVWMYEVFLSILVLMDDLRAWKSKQLLQLDISL